MQRRVITLAAALALAAGLSLVAQPGPPADAQAAPAAVLPAKGTGRATVAGTNCSVFPADNYWNADVSKLPVHRYSARWKKAIGKRDLHPDFGPAGKGEVPYGIPITVVSGKKAGVKVRFDYADESDRVRYPLNAKTRIEGGKNADGDRHAIIVNAKTCRLYELYDLRKRGGTWTAGSGATWSLRSNKLRPDTWTSADAAGLPILPGLLRYSEVKAGRVDHAIRFTAPATAARHIWPARHDAGSGSAKTRPPMGARFRLKANFSTKGYSRDAKVVIKAMKKYGLVLADNGSPWYFQGEADERWGERLISDLKTIPSSAFEAVDTSGMKRAKGSGRVG
ncbi:hypothetical protein GCM10010401_12430 [Rarobacter faecitabidus]|uniref:Uncharacterized protein n=1 Tax=Rarobacter faecitabidus TaxID=13243 RepID=A0A542ZP82_RARFA|nr:hypothetical protein [Rarobacter faecitabidus]TQL62020.1 hypothetical protein FB461_1652 [Rarobacter faecitabidus]